MQRAQRWSSQFEEFLGDALHHSSMSLASTSRHFRGVGNKYNEADAKPLESPIRPIISAACDHTCSSDFVTD
jgi:hypothetical protein